MHTKIAITISSDVLAEVDQSRGRRMSRSGFIENVLRECFKKAREAINKRDLELINANADYLNREAEDLPPYQAPIDFSSEDE